MNISADLLCVNSYCNPSNTSLFLFESMERIIEREKLIEYSLLKKKTSIRFDTDLAMFLIDLSNGIDYAVVSFEDTDMNCYEYNVDVNRVIDAFQCFLSQITIEEQDEHSSYN